MDYSIVYSEQAITVYLISGLMLGVVYSFNSFIKMFFSVNKVVNFLLDFSFAIVCVLTVFAIALTIANGRLRFIQFFCQSISFTSVVYLFDFTKRRKK